MPPFTSIYSQPRIIVSPFQDATCFDGNLIDVKFPESWALESCAELLEINHEYHLKNDFAYVTWVEAHRLWHPSMLNRNLPNLASPAADMMDRDRLIKKMENTAALQALQALS